MVWVKIDDAFPEHPKIARVGPIGAWVQIQALCYANRNLTDGFIPRAIARAFGRNGTEHIGIDEGEVGDGRGGRLASFGRECEEFDWPEIMVEAGLWKQKPGGYLIHDYSDYQFTRAQIEAIRKAKTDAGRRGGIASAKARAQARGRAPGKARAQAGAQAEFKPVPVPVPVPDLLLLQKGEFPQAPVGNVAEDGPPTETWNGVRKDELELHGLKPMPGRRLSKAALEQRRQKLVAQAGAP